MPNGKGSNQISSILLENANGIFWFNIVLSLVMASAFYIHTYNFQKEKNENLNEHFVNDVELAFQRFVYPLHGVAASVHMSRLNFTSKDFRASAESRQLYSNVKGALGFGFIRKVNTSDLAAYVAQQKKLRPDFNLRRLSASEGASDYFVIEVVEPVEINKKAVGLVVSDETRRRDAALQAMKTGNFALTRPIQLVQAQKAEPGFLYYYPVYQSPQAPRTEVEREKQIFGWAYTPFLASQIIDFVVKHNPAIRLLSIKESGAPLDDLSQIYLSENQPVSSLGSYQNRVVVGGQAWLVETQIPLYDLVSPYIRITLFVLVLVLGSIILRFWTRALQSRLSFDRAVIEKTRAEVLSATEIIQEQKQFMRFVIDKVPSVIAYIDRDLRFRLNNKASLQLIGEKSNDDVEGQLAKDILPVPVFEGNLPHMQKALLGQEQKFERVFKDFGDEPRSMVFHYVPDIKGPTVMGFVVAATDITEIRRLEAKEKAQQAQLFSRSKLSLLGEMAGGVSHEINNPLAIIKGKVLVSQTVLKAIDEQTPEIEKLIKNLSDIDKTTDRIANIVKGLRSLARDGDRDSYFPVVMKDLVSTVVDLITERTKALGIGLQLIGELPDRAIFCNKSQIQQVVLNLISNSIHAVGPLSDKWIHIMMGTTDENIEIRVVDSGLGIPPEIADRMMNPFFTTKEVGQGTGLGLSVSKQMIESHGGELKYEPFHGHTSFVITLPIKENRTILPAA